MATLVLTTVGTLVGGPIGGAIGAAIGSQVDRSLLAPKRTGPRLGDLSVQTSSYGAELPKIFGTLRVAGTVIWATDLREDRHHSGGGKSGGSTTTYSYSTSFAVALSARPIAGVGRIWADGNLLRGSAGDWKSDLGAFRLYLGDEEQPIDPLIASAEGIAATPAHRGLAYALFDTLQLADFGNRIPSLSFEIFAETDPVPVAAIAGELSDGALAGDNAATLIGYAAGGDSVRSALEGLATVFPMPLSDDGTQLRIGAADVATLDDDELGAAAEGDDRQPRTDRERRSAGALPDALSIQYYDPARDFQAGMQQSRRDGVGVHAQAIELAAAIPADQAKALAQAALARTWAARDGAAVRVPWRRMEAKAGMLAALDGDVARISGWTLEKMALQLTTVREVAGPVRLAASAGRAVAEADAPLGATVIALADLPQLGDGVASAPLVWLAAAGTAPGWRRAEVSRSLDGGASWSPAGRTALPATMGQVAVPPGDGPLEMIDARNTIEVELLNDGMSLVSIGRDALIAGGNLALCGDELLQFESATQIGATRWRLGRLLRGRRGSDWAMASHAAGENFLLLDATSLLAIDVPLAAIATACEVSAIGPGDAGVAVTMAIPIAGNAVRPPAPVGLSATRVADGTIRFAWVRRSRTGWAWIDGSDVPLGEDGEAYRVTIALTGGGGRTLMLDAAGCDYAPADQAADGMTTPSGTLAVEQLGARATSRPAMLGWNF